MRGLRIARRRDKMAVLKNRHPDRVFLKVNGHHTEGSALENFAARVFVAVCELTSQVRGCIRLMSSIFGC